METEKEKTQTKAEVVFDYVQWLAMVLILALMTYICVLTFMITEDHVKTIKLYNKIKSEQLIDADTTKGQIIVKIKTYEEEN